MTALFGRGGNKKPSTEIEDFKPNTEPSPLDIIGDKTEVIDKIISPKPDKKVGPNPNLGSGGYNGGGYGGGGGGFSSDYSSNRYRDKSSSSYQSTNSGPKARVDIVNDYSDMATADSLQDNDISNLRKDGYKLSNMEKEFDIRHKNDFNNIVKIILIVFSILVGLGFLVIIGIIVYTSYKTNTMTETGIINSILQFVADMIKIGLS